MTTHLIRPADKSTDAGHHRPPTTAGLGLAGLTALVVGSMIGSGIFGLPSQMAGSAAPGPLVIGWMITGVGMLMLAFVFQNLVARKPEIDGSVYGYARAGFGDYIGMTSAWGYWVSAWVGNVTYLVLLTATLSVFWDKLGDGNTAWAIALASIIVWGIQWIALRGVHSAALVNTIVTIAKVVPILTFIAIAAVGFKAGIFTTDIWGTSTSFGASLGSTLDQVKNMMLVTVWVFIGIEGASVYSQRAGRRSDVGKATVMGFFGVLALLLAVNLLSYGLMAQARIAGLKDPSMAYLMKDQVGTWGTNFIAVGLTISLLGALLAWVLLSVEILRLPARDHVLPSVFGHENAHGAPDVALWLTNGCVQAMLIWTYYSSSTYLKLLTLATSLILLPYLWSAAYQVLLAIRGETYEGGHGRVKDLVVGGVALGYAVWLVYAGGWEYVLVAGLFYLVGTGFFVWARKENKQVWFTAVEKVLVGVVTLLSVAAVWGLIDGWIQV